MKASLGIIQRADLFVLPEKILLPETDLDNKDSTSICSLSDYLLSQSLLPKRSTLRRVIAEVIGEVVVVVIVDGTLLPAFFSLLKASDCSRPALSDLTEIRKRG